MGRLCKFLESAPPEIVRIKGFVTTKKNQFLVQADSTNFTIEESTATQTKQGLQVIGTPAMNSKAVISAIKQIASH